MSSVFSNVNIDVIDFVKNRNDLKFDFYTSTIENEFLGSLICRSVLSLKIDTQFESDEESPFQCFICDVSVIKLKNPDEVSVCFKKLNYAYSSAPKYNEYYYVRFEGGDIDVKMICGHVEIVKE
ncbi:hypothetical protein ACFQZE_19245 [Paenibacillus sp. GCM10027627]|uniref:hypothetical protein n=1 Tax=unclassified Paenibacillus TaxID=185978 RepID=UPI0036452212